MQFKRKMWLFWSLANLLLLGVANACGSSSPASPGAEVPAVDLAALQPVSLAAGQKLAVVATTNIVGDVVRNVAGDQVALTILMDPGIDPHTYVPTPADAAAIHDAHLVFVSGGGLEANLENTLGSAGGNAVRISVSQGIEFRAAADEHDHGEVDPHVWFSVPNVVRWVETIQQALAALDPDHAAAYQANAAAYRQQLEDLDTWIAAQIATIPKANRKLVTNHPSFGYLAAEYGLEQVGTVYPISPSSEPSAQDIARLEDTIRQYDVPAVFTESTVNPRLARQVAEDTGVQLVSLYTGSLGGPDSGAQSYVEMMRYDVQAIVDALR